MTAVKVVEGRNKNNYRGDKFYEFEIVVSSWINIRGGINLGFLRVVNIKRLNNSVTTQCFSTPIKDIVFFRLWGVVKSTSLNLRLSRLISKLKVKFAGILYFGDFLVYFWKKTSWLGSPKLKRFVSWTLNKCKQKVQVFQSKVSFQFGFSSISVFSKISFSI